MLPECRSRSKVFLVALGEPELEWRSAFRMPLMVAHICVLRKLSSMNHRYAYWHTFFPYYLSFVVKHALG